MPFESLGRARDDSIVGGNLDNLSRTLLHGWSVAELQRCHLVERSEEPEMLNIGKLSCCLAVLGLCVASASAADRYGLEAGTPDLKMAGPISFAPDGILLLGDSQGGAIFAIETGDTSGNPQESRYDVAGVNAKVAQRLGTEPQQITINDVAVNPESGQVYLSVSRGHGPQAMPVLLRVSPAGEINEVALDNVKFAKATLPNLPEDRVTGEGPRARNNRLQSITDVAYVDGRVLVAGLSNEEFASKLRSIPFPFQTTDEGVSVEIYHGAHGQFETRSPIRTFVSFDIENEPHLLAAYTCTPLVKFPVSQLQPGSTLRGTTVAELGNRNNPLDMVVYEKDGKNFLLLSNSARGVMKIGTDELDVKTGITEPVKGGGTAGQSFETIDELQNVVQLDRLNDTHAVILVERQPGQFDLQTIDLP